MGRLLGGSAEPAATSTSASTDGASRPPLALAAAGVAHASAAVLCGLVLVAAGQPLFAEDTWWHLGMGASYAAQGPWLAGDPFLFDALGPPAPAAWLADLGLFGVHALAGFTGLRVLHATCVGAILALAWWLLRRESGSALYASLGTAAFAMLAAYRLFQLRPHLATIFAALLVVALLLPRGQPARQPSWPRVLAATAVFGLWANAHGAFVVGLLLVGAALCGSALGAWRASDPRRRAARLAIALVLGLAATFVNPQGAGPHGLYLSAGGASPDLALVADEWASGGLLQWPALGSLPGPAGWLLSWGLVIGTGIVAFGWLRGLRRGGRAGVDPALVAVAVASVAGLAMALRLSWLAFFPLLLLGQALAARGSLAARGTPVTAALVAALLVPAFVLFGDWPRVSAGVARDHWSQPYPATKFHAHAVWWMRDTGVEGRLFNDYGSGNFAGYWLAPGLRAFVNGSLNVPPERLKAHAAAIRAEGVLEGESLEEMLDRYRVDLFFGTGLPIFPAGRPNVQTTAHLERSRDWMPVFRNLRSAVYLRRGPGSADDLDRIARYYARAGVPFDRERGFEVAAVVRDAPEWAFQHGMIPADLQRVRQATASLDPTAQRTARRRLAGIWAVLGLYDEALALDERLLATADPPIDAARRALWSLVRLGRFEETRDAADRLERLAPPGDDASRRLAAAAREVAARAAAGRRGEATALAAVMPVFERFERSWLLSGVREPEARTR